MSEPRITGYSFGAFEIDLVRAELLCNGEPVGIRRKPFEVLSVLVSTRDRVVTKEELRDTVWPGTSVSDAALTSAIRDLRRCLGEEGRRTPRFVSTVYGRGYRFVHTVSPRVEASVAGSPFVGRRALLADGADRAEAAMGASGSVLLLAGEAGIGKTHALHEIARHAERGGMAVHVGRCLEEAGAPAYWPWTQVVRSVLDGSDPRRIAERFGEPAAEAMRVLPECDFGDSGLVAEATDVEAEAERFRIFDAVTSLLRNAADDRACLVVLDDLHRADEASVLLLRHLIREIAQARIFVLGAYRDSEVSTDHPLRAVLAELHGVGRSATLTGLSEDELTQLVTTLCGSQPGKEVVRALHVRTRGNPFFASEIARILKSEGELAGVEAARRASASSSEGIRQLVRSRVSRLGERVTATLSAAAVIGRVFDLDVLTRVRHEIGAAALCRDLDAAQAAGLIDDVPERGSGFAFSHILVRDALYEDLPGASRRGLHRAVGLAIETLRSADVESHVDELAHHFGQAAMDGEARRATQYAHRAGLLALAQAAYDQAVQRFDQALRYQVIASGQGAEAGEAGLRLRAELLVERGRALWRDGQSEPARQSFAEAVGIARKVHAADILVRAALGYAGRTDAAPGVGARVIGLLEEALEMLPTEDTPLRSEALARLGSALYYHPDSSVGERHARDAVAMAERLGDSGVLGYALSALHQTLFRPAVEPRERLEIADRLVALARVSEAREVEALGLQQSIADLAEMGDRARVEDSIRQYGRMVDALRQPFVSRMYAAYRGMLDLLDGRLAAAEARISQNLALGHRVGSPSVSPVYNAQLFILRREQGRLPELLPLLAETAESNATLWGFRVALAAAHVAAGHDDEAARIIESICSGPLDDLPPDHSWLCSFGVLSAVCVDLGYVRPARRLYAQLLPYRGRISTVGYATACDVAVDHRLAELARVLGDSKVAALHYEAALDLHSRAGARLHLAHTQRDYAGLLWKHGNQVQRERAAHLLRAAAATYRELDLAHHRAWMQEHGIEDA